MKYIKLIKAKDNYGWEISSSEAQDKLQLWIDVVGAEQAVWDLARAMGNDELASNLAYIFRMNDFREGMSKESSVGFNAKPETDLEKEVVNVSNEIMSAASRNPMNGYSMGDEEEKKKFYQLTEDYVLPVLDKYKDRLQDKEFLDLLIEDLTDNNYHAAVKAIQNYVK